MAEINWTQEAQSWLRDIHDYIAADNPEAAARTAGGIYERARSSNTILKLDIGTILSPLVQFESSFMVTIE